jgi:hypothetical protein
MQQYAKITGMSGNTITIDPPMYFTYTSGLNPQIKEGFFRGTSNIVNSGVEDLKDKQSGAVARSFI